MHPSIYPGTAPCTLYLAPPPGTTPCTTLSCLPPPPLVQPLATLHFSWYSSLHRLHLSWYSSFYPFISPPPPSSSTHRDIKYSINTSYRHIVTLVLKGGICHFEKWQIPPFKTKVTMNQNNGIINDAGICAYNITNTGDSAGVVPKLGQRTLPSQVGPSDYQSDPLSLTLTTGVCEACTKWRGCEYHEYSL